ncbi:hypothetical protein LTR17_015154 [Elasticomyces elasticus]|nr:hypothetical protein LTR17_015154 [Elasticomyces elasticus]
MHADLPIDALPIWGPTGWTMCPVGWTLPENGPLSSGSGGPVAEAEVVDAAVLQWRQFAEEAEVDGTPVNEETVSVARPSKDGDENTAPKKKKAKKEAKKEDHADIRSFFRGGKKGEEEDDEEKPAAKKTKA